MKRSMFAICIFAFLLSVPGMSDYECQMELKEYVPVEITKFRLNADGGPNIVDGVPEMNVIDRKWVNKDYFDGNYRALKLEYVIFADKTAEVIYSKEFITKSSFKIIADCNEYILEKHGRCFFNIDTGAGEPNWFSLVQSASNDKSIPGSDVLALSLLEYKEAYFHPNFTIRKTVTVNGKNIQREARAMARFAASSTEFELFAVAFEGSDDHAGDPYQLHALLGCKKIQ